MRKSIGAFLGIALGVLGCSGVPTPGSPQISLPGPSTGQPDGGYDASYVADTSYASYVASQRALAYEDVRLSELPPVPALVNPDGGALVVGLSTGSPAPWPAVAFNSEAVSSLRAGWSVQNQRCDIYRRTAVDITAASARRDLLLVGVQADLEHTSLRLALVNETRRVSELERINHSLNARTAGTSTLGAVLYSVGSFVVGGIGSWVVYRLTQ
jgi:hypothetical protein